MIVSNCYKYNWLTYLFVSVGIHVTIATSRVSNRSSPDTYNRQLLHEAQDDFAQN